MFSSKRDCMWLFSHCFWCTSEIQLKQQDNVEEDHQLTRWADPSSHICNAKHSFHCHSSNIHVGISLFYPLLWPPDAGQLSLAIISANLTLPFQKLKNPELICPPRSQVKTTKPWQLTQLFFFNSLVVLSLDSLNQDIGLPHQADTNPDGQAGNPSLPPFASAEVLHLLVWIPPHGCIVPQVCYLFRQ